tara:strand:- start:515 stop:769 length:255 start_codon:yes stop_codon:yes gene_type:complete
MHISIRVLNEASEVQEFVDEAIKNLGDGVNLQGDGDIGDIDMVTQLSDFLAELKLKVDALYNEADAVDDFFNGRGCSLSDITYL